MQDKADRPLIDLSQGNDFSTLLALWDKIHFCHLGECNCALLILVISGQATPYVHNAIAKVGVSA